MRSDLAAMTGAEFENHLMQVLKRLGCRVTGTAKTGDKGADIFAKFKTHVFVIQAKRCSRGCSGSPVVPRNGSMGGHERYVHNGGSRTMRLGIESGLLMERTSRGWNPVRAQSSDHRSVLETLVLRLVESGSAHHGQFARQPGSPPFTRGPGWRPNRRARRTSARMGSRSCFFGETGSSQRTRRRVAADFLS